MNTILLLILILKLLLWLLFNHYFYHPGNTLPVSQMPEGTIICNIESRVGDRGTLARVSGNVMNAINTI